MSLKPSELKKIITERGLSPMHVLFATFLASAAESGFLTQGAVNLMAKRVAPVINSYLKAMGYLTKVPKEPIEAFRYIVTTVNKVLGIGPDLSIKYEDCVITVKLGGDKCRYCPKGVGLAQIPGTACPFPSLIKELAKLEGINVELVREVVKGRVYVLKREGGLCVFKYRLVRA
ncbi:MAG TPA: hypothetical protein ENG05_02220 [Acidilobales archaeon]|nr:hypothetical protein [Acidilobales archaeon]